MENAADALKIVLGLLLFVVAVTIVFISLSQVIATADIVITALDVTNFHAEYDETISGDIITVIDEFGNPIMKLDARSRNRIVGIDTVISNIYRYHKESFCVTINAGTLVARLDRTQEGSAHWNLAVSTGGVKREAMDKRIDYFLSLGNGGEGTIDSKLLGFGDTYGNGNIAVRAFKTILNSGNAEFIEEFVEVNIGGTYMEAEDGTKLTIIPGGKMVYITYTKI